MADGSTVTCDMRVRCPPAVDYAGTRPTLVHATTGQVIPVELFVAVTGWSERETSTPFGQGRVGATSSDAKRNVKHNQQDGLRLWTDRRRM
jgi:hypothetical protein